MQIASIQYKKIDLRIHLRMFSRKTNHLMYFETLDLLFGIEDVKSDYLHICDYQGIFFMQNRRIGRRATSWRGQGDKSCSYRTPVI